LYFATLRNFFPSSAKPIMKIITEV
jgi:hypothetical protein